MDVSAEPGKEITKEIIKGITKGITMEEQQKKKKKRKHTILWKWLWIWILANVVFLVGYLIYEMHDKSEKIADSREQMGMLIGENKEISGSAYDHRPLDRLLAYDLGIIEVFLQIKDTLLRYVGL